MPSSYSVPVMVRYGEIKVNKIRCVTLICNPSTRETKVGKSQVPYKLSTDFHMSIDLHAHTQRERENNKHIFKKRKRK